MVVEPAHTICTCVSHVVGAVLLVDMTTSTCRGVALVTMWTLAAALVSAQITFSRDWTGGKRSAPQLAVDCTQFSRVCRHFIHELKQVMTSQITGSKPHQRPDGSEDTPLAYDED